MEPEVIGSREPEVREDAPINVASMSSNDLEKAVTGAEDLVITVPEVVKDEVKVVPEVKAKPVKEEITAEIITEENPYDKLSKELEETKQRLEAKEKFIQQRGTEIGQLKKVALSDLPQAIKEEYERIHYDPDGGPFAATQYLDRAKQEFMQAQQEQSTLAKINKVQTTRKKITADIPDFEARMDELTEILKEDGLPEQTINIFKENPYLVSEYGELRLLHRAANARKETVVLKAELETLKAENAELKKRPGELFRRVEQATKSVNGSSSGTAPKQDNVLSINKPVAALTSKELADIKSQTG